MVNDNISAGAAINWLRYMEISRSWTRIDLDNLGMLTLKATISGTSRVGEQSNTVHLNYLIKRIFLTCGAVYVLATIYRHGLSKMRCSPCAAVRTVKSVRNNNDEIANAGADDDAAGGLYATVLESRRQKSRSPSI